MLDLELAKMLLYAREASRDAGIVSRDHYLMRQTGTCPGNMQAWFATGMDILDAHLNRPAIR